MTTDEQHKIYLPDGSYFNEMSQKFGMPTINLIIDEKIMGWAIITRDTLEHIGVDPNVRRLGLGEKVLDLILDWMKNNNKKQLYFLNAHHEFWDAMKKKKPRNVKLLPGFAGRIYCS